MLSSCRSSRFTVRRLALRAGAPLALAATGLTAGCGGPAAEALLTRPQGPHITACPITNAGINEVLDTTGTTLLRSGTVCAYGTATPTKHADLSHPVARIAALKVSSKVAARQAAAGGREEIVWRMELSDDVYSYTQQLRNGRHRATLLAFRPGGSWQISVDSPDGDYDAMDHAEAAYDLIRQ